MNTKRSQSRRGFTIIEIMITVLILAISAAVVVPMIGNREDIVLAAATRKTVADLQFAQNSAIARRQSIYVRFAANEYALCTLVGTTLVVMTHPVEKDPFVVQFGPAGVSQLASAALPLPTFAGETVLGFDSLGTPFAFNALTRAKTSLNSVAQLTITSGSMSQTIEVEPYTGEITVP